MRTHGQELFEQTLIRLTVQWMWQRCQDAPEVTSDTGQPACGRSCSVLGADHIRCWTGRSCQTGGIGRKTGYRWRHENGGLPPSRITDEVRPDRYLSLLERQLIATLRERGLTVREIARLLDRAASTASRELRRNTFNHDCGRHDTNWPTRGRPSVPRQPGRQLSDSRPRGGAGQTGAGLEPAADQCLAASSPFRNYGLARRPRNDPPGALNRFGSFLPNVSQDIHCHKL